MHQRRALLTAVVVLAVAASPLVGVASADVTLTVTVKTAAGAPVSNAELIATWDGGSTTETTASNGKAFVDVPDGANVTIRVDHNVYVRNSPFTVTNASEQDVAITVWEKASASVAVTDADGAVEDVRVVFRKGGDIVKVLSTDGDGEVASGVIESGEYALTFFKQGYFRKAVTLNVEDETTADVAIERGSVTVQFRVLDDSFESPRPIGDATISGAEIGSVPTQPDGKRAVSVPVNTELTVTVEKDEYETVSETIVVRESDRTVNITTRKQPAVNLELANERVVVGESVLVTVTDEYGEPLPDATVFLDGSEVGQPDDSGTIRVPIESAGNHTLFASLDQLTSARVTVTGVQPGADGTPATDDQVTTTTDDRSSGDSIRIGDIELRSTAIGIAGGLVLATVLFIFFRFR